MESRNY
jgi:chromosome segregation ATPase